MQSGNIEQRKAQREANRAARAKAQRGPAPKPARTVKGLLEAGDVPETDEEMYKLLTGPNGKNPKKSKPKSAKAGGTIVWALGRVTVDGMEILAIDAGPEAHNRLESRSRDVNGEAKTRVAFIVDAAHLPHSIPMVREYFTAGRLVGSALDGESEGE